MHRVLVVCKTLLKGGAEKQALILAKLMQEHGMYVSVVNLTARMADRENIKFIEENSIRYFPLSGFFLKKFCSIRSIMKEGKMTVVVSYLTQANFLAGLCRIFNREIISLGGIRNEKLPFYKLVFEKLIHNHLNDLTIFNNYSAREKLIAKGFRSEKIKVIQNTIEADYASFEKTEPNNDGVIKIITVGRFVKQKDYPTSISSFKSLVDRNVNMRFKYLIVGYGPLENEIRTMVNDLDLTSSVEILINPSDIENLLRASDIFLSTSTFEGVSNSIMEAIACGLPVVATDVGDNRYLVRDGVNGFLVPCKSVGPTVEKLEFLAESVEIRREYGKNSRSIIESSFSKANFADQYIRLFSSLQNRKDEVPGQAGFYQKRDS